MSVTYLTTPIVEVRYDPPPRGSGMTREGYTKLSGAPTDRMIRLQGEKRWRRLMVWQFSNLGTMFVRIAGVPHVVREETIPEVAAAQHATKKKSSVQLEREIAEVLAKKPADQWTVHDRLAVMTPTQKKRELKDLQQARDGYLRALGYAGNTPDQVSKYHTAIEEIDAKMRLFR